MRDYAGSELLRPCAGWELKARQQARWFAAHRWKALPALMLILSSLKCTSLASGQTGTGVLLPDGREFVSWERPLQFSKTYYVDNRNPRAADSSPGTKELPFLTINKAAQMLEAGERVVIMTGVYRERVVPLRGGSGPDKMISYEAAPGANVVVKGSHLVKTGWEPSTGYALEGLAPAARSQLKIYERHLDDLDFQGYNPFAMVNMQEHFFSPRDEDWRPFLLRRGMVFVDGQRLEQVESYQELGRKDGVFWCGDNGLSVHLRLAHDGDPARHEAELVVQEQIFAPVAMGLNYVRIKGITFEHAANGFPVPQRGMVSANRGNHWIIEDCSLRHANGVALDIGAQHWDMERPAVTGVSVVRRNHIDDVGICGIAGLGVQDTLIEENLIEHVGYQDAELQFETGGIKLHETKNCLLRHNVIRHMIHSEAIWLDYANVNTRVTGNVMGDTLETIRGGIYLEASHDADMLDHNIIWKATEGKGGTERHNLGPLGGWGITLEGTDHAVIAHNLIGYSQDAGIKFRVTEDRIVETRGGTARRNKVLNNIFYHCGKGIDFANTDNTADGNLYLKDWGEATGEYQSVGRGLNWISGPGLPSILDLEAWQEFFGFDRNGAYTNMTIDVDLDALTMTWSFEGTTPEVSTEKHFQHDFFGQAAGEKRKPGPLLSLPNSPTQVNIDPRAQ